MGSIGKAGDLGSIELGLFVFFLQSFNCKHINQQNKSKLTGFSLPLCSVSLGPDPHN